MRIVLAGWLIVLACAPASAGELVFANGNRLTGELSNESLMVSTGAGLVEVAPNDVVALSRDEVGLRDGRVIKGTLVGGQVKARTSLGEIAIKVDELQSYRASEPAAPTPAGQTAALSQSAATSSAAQAPGAPARSDPGVPGVSGGLPTVAAYQSSGAQSAVQNNNGANPPGTRVYEVAVEGAMYRDALSSSSRVGRVVTGQQVRYVDSIDRRLRILNLLVFDGGHWVKIRLSDGTEGWVPADTVREVR
jgi:SH3 domain-containing protein